jgi:geranylgeranyl transferase type-2 subunit beta
LNDYHVERSAFASLVRLLPTRYFGGMRAEPYLIRLANRLTWALSRMERSRRERHCHFIRSMQMPDGGFRGREGDSDLYYTGFAVRALAILGGLDGEFCRHLGAFLNSQRFERLNIIDLLSWLYAGIALQAAGHASSVAAIDDDFADRIVEMLESVRTRDGGYAKSAEGAAGSTYHSFLVAQIYELIGRSVPDSDRLLQFVYDRQRDDGGFVEISPMKRSGTNPTAAAVALLIKMNALDEEVRGDVCGFLTDVRSDEGGFQANSRIPFADGLSTFTGLLTAQDVGCGQIVELRAVEDYIARWLEFPTGGFRGASWDEQADVEYTFYGLGTLGLCWSAE